MNEAAHQAFGEGFAEAAYRLLSKASKSDRASHVPAIREALSRAVEAFAKIAGEDVEQANEAAQIGFDVRGAELGYFDHNRPRTLAEAIRRRRASEIIALLNMLTPNSAQAYVARLGADPETVARRCGRVWAFRDAQLVRGDCERGVKWAPYEFVRAKGSFAVVEALAEGGELLLDFVVWNIAEPGIFWTLLGAANILGEPSTAGDKPLIVHRSPAAWLAAGGEGVVILSDRAGPDLASAPGAIVADDLEHARELARLVHLFADPRRIVLRAAA